MSVWSLKIILRRILQLQFVGFLAALLLAPIPVMAEPARVPSIIQRPTETKSQDDVTGVLGGKPVRIPRYFVRNLQYAGDPGWGRKAQVSVDRSVIASFGFSVRFPDMSGMSTEELKQDKRAQKIYETNWINVGLNAAENYPGNGFLDRRTMAIGKSSGAVPFENYREQSEKQFDLTVYSAVGSDPKTGQPYRMHQHASDIFVHRDATGRVDAYIRCGNRKIASETCRHDFDLSPKADVQVYVSYRRGLLPKWREIQMKTQSLIVGFIQVP